MSSQRSRFSEREIIERAAKDVLLERVDSRSLPPGTSLRDTESEPGGGAELVQSANMTTEEGK